ncbi:hypothetical protein [Lacticaseibacillus paracasei]|uniref:Uncharacterized protein n=1 Tax=Lacticaseibacillus paracasei (strain ATCC 334 / BCRC 17002 / CCUG 31169 / CIP 107868 / KCTC 3260 / NRRL B-441) TaxID=321967 RepID=Q035F1_LACP3|nr:hypothetical protein [Lacticaseibacillus paracasei]PTS56073.1 hypothetical protein DBQ61_10335 [Lactobacillus sp. DS22_6]ABJ71171.1 hypothetical protein LSEI_2435 [Lacticaseibacillus paracasei ATCC 334]MSC18051.1 hypothetical protein [Lacticaseibacillus paracasei]MSC30971.1 hypothetical protein [Lacticaseibacillus paracasei]MSC37297.1 hypothetical protein [Lacticaseibacillus paracasei]
MCNPWIELPAINLVWLEVVQRWVNTIGWFKSVLKALVAVMIVMSRKENIQVFMVELMLGLH